jgi:hypothetical protein
MGKTCFETVRNLSGKADYENRSKKQTQDFSRNRKTPFKKLMWFMLNMAKESSQNALERFFSKIKEAARMTRRALSLARGKVKRKLFGNCSRRAWREAVTRR